MTEKRLFWKRLVGIGILFVFLGLIFSCGGGPTPQPPQPKSAQGKPAKKPTAKEKEEALEEKKELGWVYDPTGKQNPFQPPREITSRIVTTNPLLKYEAHIILPDGSDHFVSVGAVLGINQGIVKQILPDGIVVEERYIDPRNPEEIRIVEKVLRMESAEEEKRKIEQILK